MTFMAGNFQYILFVSIWRFGLRRKNTNFIARRKVKQRKEKNLTKRNQTYKTVSKGQYHAIFSNTLKIEKTLFG